mmetsp:Transcript_55531/g.108739  ORF Transcript_55531/g.108739 Transcript_55531/m.108739 type:complete len:89 (-) Transcript_55531:292-558(-)
MIPPSNHLWLPPPGRERGQEASVLPSDARQAITQPASQLASSFIATVTAGSDTVVNPPTCSVTDGITKVSAHVPRERTLLLRLNSPRL